MSSGQYLPFNLTSMWVPEDVSDFQAVRVILEFEETSWPSLAVWTNKPQMETVSTSAA